MVYTRENEFWWGCRQQNNQEKNIKKLSNLQKTEPKPRVDTLMHNQQQTSSSSEQTSGADFSYKYKL